MNFCNLHTHSMFSILDGCVTIDRLVNRASELEMSSIALTDHGNVSGAIAFYQACKKKGINPIVGCEMYIDDNRDEKTRDYNHVIILCKNYKGYLNLLKIVSEANIKGFYYRPRTTTEMVFENSEGLIISTACMNGLLSKGTEKQIITKAKKWKKKFGEDFYIELQINEMAAQIQYNQMLLDIADRTNIEPLVTLDSHYAIPKDIALQDFILAVRANKTMKDKTLQTYSARNLYLMSKKELWNNCQEWGHKISKKVFNRMCNNSVRIADRCDLEIPFGKVHIPKMGMTKKEFESFVKKVAKKRGILKKKGYKKRLINELRVINKLGFHDYFLIVYDVVNWCNENNIFVGPARGSVAGSLVSYILDITKIDPIPHSLLFERFLNESRVDMPDIDLDFDANKRDRIFEYLANKYGKNKVARVGTFGAFGKVGALKDIGRVFELPQRPIDEIANEIYRVGAEDESAFKKAYENISGTLKDFWKRHKKWIKFAKAASELLRNTGVHPCGLLITPKPVYHYCPLVKAKGAIVSGYTEGIRGRELSDIGLVKLDILGLNTCSIISDSVDLVKQHSGKDLGNKIWNLNLKNKKLIKEAQKGNTTGGFQFETESAIKLLRKIQPETFDEIAAINAINRPGPLGAGAVDRFLYREGMEINSDEINALLADTRGVLVYQEQVMRIFHLVGYTLIEADRYRKLAAKKMFKDVEVKKLKKDFIKRASKKMDKEDATDLWKIILSFTKYSFNKSHSVAYTYLFFQVLYLKNYYPKEFFCGLLSNTTTATIKDKKHGSEQNKLNRYIGEARKYGVKILPPDINASKTGFIIGEDGIRFGLDKIKTIKGASAEEIIKKQPFTSFQDFIKRISGKVHKGKIVNLIRAGVFDCLEQRQAVKRQFNSIRKEQIFDLKKSNVIKDATEAFGFVLYHPFFNEDVKSYLLSMYCISSHQLRKFQRWNSVCVAGIILSVETRMSGKSSKVVKIQDHRGDVFVYLNKETDKKFSKYLEKHKIIFVQGKLLSDNKILCYNEGEIIDITSKVEDKMGGALCQSGILV